MTLIILIIILKSKKLHVSYILLLFYKSYITLNIKQNEKFEFRSKLLPDVSNILICKRVISTGPKYFLDIFAILPVFTLTLVNIEDVNDIVFDIDSKFEFALF
jgi:hypothetical protein